MFLQNTKIHHNEDSGLLRLFRSRLIDDSLLHPYRGSFQLNCLIDNFFDELRPPKNVDDVDLLRNIQQGGIGFFSQRLSNAGVNGNDPVSLRLHVGGDAVTRAKRIVGETNYSNGLRALQEIADRVSTGIRGQANILAR